MSDICLQNDKSSFLASGLDTYMSMNVDDYIAILKREGFEQVLNIPFQVDQQHLSENFYIFASKEGFIMCFDTYNKTIVGGGSVYFNSPYRDDITFPDVKSSGHVSKDGKVLVKDIDCRERLIDNLAQIRKFGILPMWKETPFLWFLHYGDEYEARKNKRDIDYKKINNERFKMLPEWVQKIITPWGVV